MTIARSLPVVLFAMLLAAPAQAAELQFAWSVREMMNTLAQPGVDPAFARSGYFAFFAQPDLADVHSLSVVSPRPTGTDRWLASTERLKNVDGTWAAFYDDNSPTKGLVALVSGNTYFLNGNHGGGLVIPGSSSNCVGCFGKKSQTVSALLPETAQFVITVDAGDLVAGQTVNWHWRVSAVQLPANCGSNPAFKTIQFDMPASAGGAQTPEPATLGLLAAGCSVFLYLKRRTYRI